MTYTILLTEDEPTIRGFMCQVLESQGYEVLRACNGEDALRQARNHDGPIHLLLADVVMPLMSGFTVAEELTPSRPETRVLFLSGYAEESDVVRDTLRNSHADFLLKPFTCETFLRRVRALLAAPPGFAGAGRLMLPEASYS